MPNIKELNVFYILTCMIQLDVCKYLTVKELIVRNTADLKKNQISDVLLAVLKTISDIVGVQIIETEKNKQMKILFRKFSEISDIELQKEEFKNISYEMEKLPLYNLSDQEYECIVETKVIMSFANDFIYEDDNREDDELEDIKANMKDILISFLRFASILAAAAEYYDGLFLIESRLVLKQLLNDIKYY